MNALFTTSAPGAVATLVVIGGRARFSPELGVAVVSALIPAREAARVAPAEAMRREAREHERTHQRAARPDRRRELCRGCRRTLPVRPYRRPPVAGLRGDSVRCGGAPP